MLTNENIHQRGLVMLKVEFLFRKENNNNVYYNYTTESSKLKRLHIAFSFIDILHKGREN